MSAISSEAAIPLSRLNLRHKPKVGLLYCIATPLLAGISTIEGITLGGINYTGPLWLGALALGLCLLLFEKAIHRERATGFPLVPWLAWSGFIWSSLAWCDGLGMRNVQDALQLTMPLLVGLLAATFVRNETQLHLLISAFWPTLFMLLGVALAWKAGILEALGLDCALRSTSLMTVLVGCVAISAYPPSVRSPIIIWGACMLITVITGSRMATIALLLAPMLYSGYRSRLWNISALGVAAAMGLGLFYTPTFQERFFFTGEGTLQDVVEGNFLSYGRFESWPDIWEEAWRHPFLGAGAGSTYTFVPTVWEGMYHVHNDYLRIFFEFGLVGLWLFLIVSLWQIASLRQRVLQATGVERRAFAASLLGFVLFLITCATDNTLIYNLWFTNPLFAVMGAAYGVRSQRSDDQLECRPSLVYPALSHWRKSPTAGGSG